MFCEEWKFYAKVWDWMTQKLDEQMLSPRSTQAVRARALFSSPFGLRQALRPLGTSQGLLSAHSLHFNRILVSGLRR